jgi:hypothetical protein
MKCIYDASDNTLQEQSEMEKPYNYGLIDEMMRKDFLVGVSEGAISDVKRYNAHIASLRRLPCSPEVVNSFRHGGVYEEGKDYEVTGLYMGTEKEGMYAVPLQPPESEDADWKELIEYVESVEWVTDHATMMAKLKSKFIIQRKNS